jgi:hypothetical protein
MLVTAAFVADFAAGEVFRPYCKQLSLDDPLQQAQAQTTDNSGRQNSIAIYWQALNLPCKLHARRVALQFNKPSADSRAGC